MDQPAKRVYEVARALWMVDYEADFPDWGPAHRSDFDGVHERIRAAYFQRAVSVINHVEYAGYLIGERIPHEGKVT